MLAAVGRIYLGVFGPPALHVVSFNPGAVIAVGNLVLRLAASDAVAAANALGNIHQHAPPVFRHLVVGRCFRRSRQNVLPGDGGGRQKDE